MRLRTSPRRLAGAALLLAAATVSATAGSAAERGERPGVSAMDAVFVGEVLTDARPVAGAARATSTFDVRVLRAVKGVRQGQRLTVAQPGGAEGAIIVVQPGVPLAKAWERYAFALERDAGGTLRVTAGRAGMRPLAD